MGKQSTERGERHSAGAYRKIRRAILIASAIFLAMVCVLALKWPFTRAGIVRRLERASSAKVEIQNFRSTYFPPGCVAENVVFHKSTSSGQPPLLTIRKLTIQSSFHGLIGKTKRISEIVAEGVRIHLQRGGDGSAPGEEQQRKAEGEMLVVEKLRVENALLEIAHASQGRPLALEIHRAVFRNVSRQNTVPYEIALHVPLPPGEIQSSGWIGPLKEERGSYRETPVSGFYTVQRADLNVFRGLGGMVSSRGEFSGTLERLNLSGSTESPDFEVKASGHRFRLSTQFHGALDLHSGDLTISRLTARLGNTNLEGQARIFGWPKTVELNVTRGRGEIQDLILLFSKAPRSPVTGPVSFHAVAVLPHEPRPFKQRVRLTGDFVIDPARFSSPNTQQHVDQLSERAQGEKDKHKDYDADDDAAGFESVVTRLGGHVALKDGTATFSEITFRVPGAQADMNGTYSLMNKKVDLRGKMRMQAKLSQATTGAKSFFLKLLDPAFKKKGAGSEVGVAMTGTYGHTQFKARLK